MSDSLEGRRQGLLRKSPEQEASRLEVASFNRLPTRLKRARTRSRGQKQWETHLLHGDPAPTVALFADGRRRWRAARAPSGRIDLLVLAVRLGRRPCSLAPRCPTSRRGRLDVGEDGRLAGEAWLASIRIVVVVLWAKASRTKEGGGQRQETGQAQRAEDDGQQAASKDQPMRAAASWTRESGAML